MRELIVVIPVYNEAACIADVIRSWQSTLDGLSADYEILVLDDGSTDETATVLSEFEGEPRVSVTAKPNSGHGPTVLLGYRMACPRARWVFQCDSDDEMPASSFPTLWHMRDDFDAVFGARTGRSQGAGRRLISATSRFIVNLAYGAGVQDVNTPYRLMRASLLGPIVLAIPETTFAPNLVVSGTLALAGARIANISVPHQNRRTGTVSIVRWRLWKAAAKSLVETIVLARTMRVIARRITSQGEAT
jgi:glycosyltransferase involved in cell wall biosynthesis